MSEPMHHVHWDEAALIAAALDTRTGRTGRTAGSDGARLGEAAACPVCAQRLAELEGFFTQVREVSDRHAASLAGEPGGERVRRLVESVLARTTREDPSWRGDLRLVGGFLGARLRSSVLLRVAAASLLVHLAVLPVLAYYGLWQTRPEGFRTGIETPALAPPFSEDVEPEHAVEVEPLTDLFEVLPEVVVVEPGEALRVRSARRWARYHLGHQGAPEPGVWVPANEHPASRWLVARSRTILAAGEPLGATLNLAALVERAPSDALEGALRCEWLLDRWALGDGAQPELARRVQLALASVGSAARGEVRLLELAVLGRARAYGLATAADLTKLERLASELERSRWRAIAGELGAGALRPGAPLDRAWIAALGVAAGEELGRGPFGRSWLDWRE